VDFDAERSKKNEHPRRDGGGAPEVAEEAQLAECAPRVDQVLEGVGDLLDSDLLAGLEVARGADDPVGALADRLDWRVLGVDLEVCAPELVARLTGHRALFLHREVGSRHCGGVGGRFGRARIGDWRVCQLLRAALPGA
jgi:hypothetical protein